MGDLSKADDLFQKAQKKLKAWNPFGNKHEDAAELLEKASNLYKLSKAWKQATETLKLLADVQLKLDSKHDAATSYVEAAKCAMKDNMGEATVLLQKAVDLFTDMGRLNMAARQLKELAEVQEKQGLKQEAMAFYAKASDLFAIENSNSDSNKCRLKIAEFSAELGGEDPSKYAEAVEIFEDVAKASVENNLLKFGAKGHLLNAGVVALCYLSAEDVRAKLDRYKDIDFNFNGSRECTLLENLVDGLESNDKKKFSQALYDFDSLTRLDAWKTNLLLRVQARIQARIEGKEPEDDDDEGVL